MNILAFVVNTLVEFVNSQFFMSFGFLLMALGFLIVIINVIRRIISDV